MEAVEETQVGEQMMNSAKSNGSTAKGRKAGPKKEIPYPDAAAIARILGIKKKIRSGRDLHDLILRGLPKDCLQRCASRVTSDPREQRKVIHLVIPPSTYRRRTGALTFVESDNAARLARVIATALYVWNDEEAAGRFLTSFHPMLGETPIEMCDTDPGTQCVEEILWSLFHGIPGGGGRKTDAEARKDLARYERLFEFSLKVIKDKEKARAWFSRKNPALQGRTPFECCLTAKGASEVEEILAQLHNRIFD